MTVKRVHVPVRIAPEVFFFMDRPLLFCTVALSIVVACRYIGYSYVANAVIMKD